MKFKKLISTTIVAAFLVSSFGAFAFAAPSKLTPKDQIAQCVQILARQTSAAQAVYLKQSINISPTVAYKVYMNKLTVINKVYNHKVSVLNKVYNHEISVLNKVYNQKAFIINKAAKAKLVIQKRTQTVLSKTYDPAKRVLILKKEQIALSKIDAWVKKEIAKLNTKMTKANIKIEKKSKVATKIIAKKAETTIKKITKKVMIQQKYINKTSENLINKIGNKHTDK